MAKHAAANNSGASALRPQPIHRYGGESIIGPGILGPCLYLAAPLAHQLLDERSPNMPCKGQVPSCHKDIEDLKEYCVVSQDPFAVNGSVLIRVNMTNASPCIVLHARDMTISHVAIEEPHMHGELILSVFHTIEYICMLTGMSSFRAPHCCEGTPQRQYMPSQKLA